MRLAESPLMFVFSDVSDVDAGRDLLENYLGLRLIENQFHPPHEHHGLVKYDVGGTIVSLNLFAERRFAPGYSDGLTMVYRTADPALLRTELDAFGQWDNERFTDHDGHHFQFVPGTPEGLRTDLLEVRLVVPDLDECLGYYLDAFGFELLDRTERSARLATGTTDLVLDESATAPDGQLVRRKSYLVVFHAPDIHAAYQAMRGRGVTFSQDVGFSDIGATARFRDPGGNTFCLYQPSAESLAWGSGPKVVQLSTPRPRQHAPAKGH
ncbi:VOC family protein [Nocardia sp. NPDC050175]|uniref:VOC family protein n=1 Tax=Nocardia sp. NPDC050175 TaxID=3364317 RepID=UPI0037B9A8CF